MSQLIPTEIAWLLPASKVVFAPISRVFATIKASWIVTTVPDVAVLNKLKEIPPLVRDCAPAPSKVTVAALLASKDAELPPLLFHVPETVIVPIVACINFPLLLDNVTFTKSLLAAGINCPSVTSKVPSTFIAPDVWIKSVPGLAAVFVMVTLLKSLPVPVPPVVTVCAPEPLNVTVFDADIKVPPFPLSQFPPTEMAWSLPESKVVLAAIVKSLETTSASWIVTLVLDVAVVKS